jgi:hypothetical protein
MELSVRPAVAKSITDERAVAPDTADLACGAGHVPVGLACSPPPATRDGQGTSYRCLNTRRAGWASSFPAGPPDKDGLARIVEADGGRDDAENSYYEEAADPGFVRVKKRGAGSAVSTAAA